MHSSKEGHRVHLRSLAHQEQAAAYKRRDYLSHEWQLGLWREEVKGMLLQPSPQSATAPTEGAGLAVTESPSRICVAWREKITEWKYRLVDRFNLDRELVSISTFYLDQYLSMNYVDEELFQLVSMTCIYLAIKIHSPKKMDMESVASTGNGLITAQHIEVMELSIMKCLKWHLFPPTAIAFIENIFPLLAPMSDYDDDTDDDDDSDNAEGGRHKAADDALEFSRFLVELSVCAYPFACARPSSVALAAVLYSLEVCGLSLQEGGEDDASALRYLVLGTAARAPEVEACGRLLRGVHRLALPGHDGDE